MASLTTSAPLVALTLAIAGAGLLGCGDDGDGAGGAGGAGATSATTGGETSTGSDTTTSDATTGGDATSTSSGEAETCTATFRVLQKDAYKETAGRSSDLWPPHTTTVIEVACDGEVIDEVFQANHGTAPGDVDAAGDVILVEQATYEAVGTRAELGDLLDAYLACSCESETEFLSLDSLQGELAEGLLGTVIGYVETNLTCPGTTLDDLVAALEMGDVETATAIFPTCTWAGGTSFEAGLSEAFAEIVAETGELLADYHVCNNDAAVQMALFDRFAADGSLACARGDACRGPLWLYVAD